MSCARVPAAAAIPGSANDAAKGQSVTRLYALGIVDALYMLLKSALPEADVDSVMIFILQVCFPYDLCPPIPPPDPFIVVGIMIETSLLLIALLLPQSVLVDPWEDALLNSRRGPAGGVFALTGSR
jgi:hypothetical protein